VALLRPKSERRRNRPLRPYTIIECPMNGFQVSWCMGLCEPVKGNGLCGRPAPHLLVGRTQAAIAAYVRRHGSSTIDLRDTLVGRRK